MCQLSEIIMHSFTRFRPSQVKEVIDSILEEKLTSFVYEKEAVDEMALVISNVLRNRMIGLCTERVVVVSLLSLPSKHQYPQR